MGYSLLNVTLNIDRCTVTCSSLSTSSSALGGLRLSHEYPPSIPPPISAKQEAVLRDVLLVRLDLERDLLRLLTGVHRLAILKYHGMYMKQ